MPIVRWWIKQRRVRDLSCFHTTMTSRNRSTKSSAPAASQSNPVLRSRAVPTTQADKDRVRNEFGEGYHRVTAFMTDVLNAEDDKSRKEYLGELQSSLVSRDSLCAMSVLLINRYLQDDLRATLKKMDVFPTGAWYFERDFADPATWAPPLRDLPPSNGLARCITAILSISTVMSALSQPAMESEIEDDSGEDELDDEEVPAVVKVQRASDSKKGESSVDNVPPVRFETFVHCCLFD